MSPVLVVVTDVLIQQPSQMFPIQHDHMIQEIATHTAHPALGNSVLPGTAECGANRLAAHRLDSRDHIGTELGVPIEDQESLRLLAVFPSFAQLQDDPEGIRLPSYAAVQDLPPVVTNDKEAIQNAEGE